MAFKFERFTDVGASFAARVTVRRTGQLGFTSGAVNRFKIRDYEFAVLYFDPGKRVVGVELTDDGGADGAIPIRKTEANTYIRAKNFCDRFGIDYSQPSRHELKLDPESGYLYFEMAGEDVDEQEEEEGRSRAAGD